MELRCPGRESNAKLDVSLITCPQCKSEVELFGDEIRVHCRCGHWVFREAVPSCAQWCKEASRCFGHIEGIPKAVKDSCAAEDLKLEEERFRELQALVLASLGKCSKPEIRDRSKV